MIEAETDNEALAEIESLMRIGKRMGQRFNVSVAVFI